MADGQVLGVGFYPIDPKWGTPLSGPHYTRQEAIKASRRTDGAQAFSCCILEVEGQPQLWLGHPGQVVPYNNIKAVVLEDGRTLDVIRLAPDVKVEDLETGWDGKPLIPPDLTAAPTAESAE